MSKEAMKQKPVAWVEAWANGEVQVHEENCFSDDPVWLSNPIPLYTAPPKREWVGLTHDEVNSWELPDCPTVFEFAQFIEAKLMEKNT